MKMENTVTSKYFKVSEKQRIAEMAKRDVDDIVTTIAKPDGFARLTPQQKRFLLAAILGAIVPADSKVKDVEIKRVKMHLAKKFHLTPDLLDEALHIAQTGMKGDELHAASKTLPELLSIDDRVNLIGALWEVALCDLELAQEEESMIMKIADLAQVPRKRVIELQSQVARKGYIS